MRLVELYCSHCESSADGWLAAFGWKDSLRMKKFLKINQRVQLILESRGRKGWIEAKKLKKIITCNVNEGKNKFNFNTFFN